MTKPPVSYWKGSAKRTRHFKRSALPLQRLQVSLAASDIVFNRCVALDHIWIGKKVVLHVLDIDTGFNSASFLSYQVDEAERYAFVI